MGECGGREGGREGGYRNGRRLKIDEEGGWGSVRWEAVGSQSS